MKAKMMSYNRIMTLHHNNDKTDVEQKFDVGGGGNTRM